MYISLISKIILKKTGVVTNIFIIIKKIYPPGKFQTQKFNNQPFLKLKSKKCVFKTFPYAILKVTFCEQYKQFPPRFLLTFYFFILGIFYYFTWEFRVVLSGLGDDT